MSAVRPWTQTAYLTKRTRGASVPRSFPVAASWFMCFFSTFAWGLFHRSFMHVHGQKKKSFVNIAHCPHESVATPRMAWGTSCLGFDEADIPVVSLFCFLRSISSPPRHKLAWNSNHCPRLLHQAHSSHDVVDVDLKGKKRSSFWDLNF